jgi:8-oxo-dGTP pyrophosphatase MutT (NUDIX family)
VPLIKQSGAIVVRFDTAEPEVLLVTSRRSPGHWIFPKGHIERGETAEAGALREALEEAGVVGKSIGRAGVLEHRFLGIKRRIDYFLAELVREAGPPEDGRKRAWCGYDEALERLSFKDMRKLLRDAWGQLPRRERREGRERREARERRKGREARERRERPDRRER